MVTKASWRRNRRVVLRAAVAAQCLALCYSMPAFAEKPTTVQVEVEAGFEAASALGILMSAEKFVHKPASKMEAGSGGKVIVSFPLENEELSGDVMASAMVMSAQGDVAFGNIKQISSEGQGASLSAIPECKAEEIKLTPAMSQHGVLESLVSVRVERLKYNKNRAAKLLSGEFLDRLREIERGLGFDTNEELSANLHPLDLITRLSNISQAMKNALKKSEMQSERQRLRDSVVSPPTKDDTAEEEEVQAEEEESPEGAEGGQSENTESDSEES